MAFKGYDDIYFVSRNGHNASTLIHTGCQTVNQIAADGHMLSQVNVRIPRSEPAKIIHTR